MESKQIAPEMPKELIDWINEQLKEYGGGDKTVEKFMTAAFVLLYNKLHEEKRKICTGFYNWGQRNIYYNTSTGQGHFRDTDEIAPEDPDKLFDLYLLSLTQNKEI